MSAELPPPEEELDTYLLAGRSLGDWHRWLCIDQQTGADQTHARTPCSRYGNTTYDTAWFAIASAIAYVDAAPLEGTDAAMEELVGYLQGLAVNDHPDIARLIVDGWHLMPECLRSV